MHAEVAHRDPRFVGDLRRSPQPLLAARESPSCQIEAPTESRVCDRTLSGPQFAWKATRQNQTFGGSLTRPLAQGVSSEGHSYRKELREMDVLVT